MAVNIYFIILIFEFVFGNGKEMVKVKDANMKMCTLPKKCFKKYDFLVCREFKTLREIDLKWENCFEYKKLLSVIFFYPSKKIILDSSLNWNSFELKNLIEEYLGIRLENLKGFDIDSKSLRQFLNMKIFKLTEFKSIPPF